MKVEFFEGSSGQWSWRLFGDNGQVFANGAKTYATEKGASDAAGRMSEALGGAEIIRTPLNPDAEAEEGAEG